MPTPVTRKQYQPIDDQQQALNLRMNSSITRVPGCEFCDEFANPRASRFGQIYAGKVNSRIIAKKNGFVAMPTMGQLFMGSLLVMPLQHFETMAELPEITHESLFMLLADLAVRMEPLGLPILFEHGAQCTTGGSCGIYHAHFHLVPVPKPIYCTDVMPPTAEIESSLLDVLNKLKKSDQYLLFQDTAGAVAFAEPATSPSREFSSQYFRRAIVDYFALEKSWDWQKYEQPEPLLFDTLRWFSRKRSNSKNNRNIHAGH